MIVTNMPGLLSFDASGPLLLAPRSTTLSTRNPDPDFGSELRAVGDLVRSRSAIVVHYPDLLDGGPVRSGMVVRAKLVRLRDCGGEPALFVAPADAERFERLLGC
jgi:hypothetical protein